MKHIDAEKLKAQIKGIIAAVEVKKHPDEFGSMEQCMAAAEIEALNLALDCVKELRQEQPEFVNKIWHKVSEEANLTRPVVLSDGDKYMSPPCTFPFKDMSGFVNAMNKRYKADYTIWAYMDDLLNISSLQQEQQMPDSEPWFRPATREEVPDSKPHWKPSKEQMKALEASYSVLKTHDTWGEDEHLPLLLSLYNDLQKLL